MCLAICLCLSLLFLKNVLFIFNLLSFFFFLAITCTQPGIEPTPSELEEHSLNHWIARQAPAYHYFLTIKKSLICFLSHFPVLETKIQITKLLPSNIDSKGA